MAIEHILPFRTYSLAIQKWLPTFLYLDRFFKLDWTKMSDNEKKINKPVFLYATPKKAFSNITTPLVNGQLTSFGVAFYLGDFSYIDSMNGTIYNYIPITIKDEQTGNFRKIKLSHPLAITMTYNFSFQCVSMLDAEELMLRWQMEVGPEKVLKINEVWHKLIWNGTFTNNTQMDVGVGDKQWIRFDTSLQIPVAHLPQKIFTDLENIEPIKKLYLRYVNEDLEIEEELQG